ncbi:MAG: hypothetical protein K8R99_15480 [Actinomycetia bacterium]|nr:hypothetical protein [Actinomycetes bacterium]
MFDRRAKRVALWWRPGEHPDKRIAALQNEQVAIAQLYERIRLVGSKNRASEAETITQIVGKIVYVDEEEHGALAFIEPDSTLVDVHIETFSSGARADLKADGMSRFYRWRQRRGN